MPPTSGSMRATYCPSWVPSGVSEETPKKTVSFEKPVATGMSMSFMTMFS